MVIALVLILITSRLKQKALAIIQKIILAGRELNDNMGNYVAKELVRKNEKKISKLKEQKF